MTVGILEAVTGIIAEEDNLIGGYRITRLTATATAGATTVNVESTTGWPDSGKVGIDGLTYYYSSKTLTSLIGITYVKNGVTLSGLLQDHFEQTDVIDVSRQFSGIDLLRRAMLVDYAEAEDLNALGRNLGVFRLPFVGDDDVFRDIIKALAYNPRGTLHGLELALDAMVGPGNYEIIENLIENPCTVFINLLGDIATNNNSNGKWFAGQSGIASIATALDTVLINSTDPIIRVGGVKFKDENHITDCTVQKPSAETLEEYDGDPGTTLWEFLGNNEATDVVLTAGSHIQFSSASVLSDFSSYIHRMRMRNESKAYVEMVFRIPAGAVLDSDTEQFGFILYDETKRLQVGVADSGGGLYDIGFASGASFAGPPQVTNLAKDVWHTVALQKDGTKPVELYFDGQLVQTLAWSSFGPSGSDQPRLWFGIIGDNNNDMLADVKSIGFYSHTTTDYWASRGTGADLNIANPDQIDVNIVGHFINPDDVGKMFRIYDAANAVNNGTFYVDTVNTDEIVTLIGKQKTNGVVPTGGPNMEAFVEPTAFEYPYDVGKKVIITNSPSNNGTYYISKIFREGSNFTTDLASFLTPVPEKSSEIELSTTWPVVTPAALTPETGMEYRVDPNFVTEAGVSWELSDAGSLSGYTITLRQDLPQIYWDPPYVKIMDVYLTEVLSSQVLEDETYQNIAISEVPLLFEFYPIYISDPLGFIKTYLDEITAAGVIPEFAGF